MDREGLDHLMAELAEELRALKIPLSRKILPQVRVNSRARKRLGCCFLQNGWYTIEISDSLLDRPELLRQTLCHELLHTCPGCRNHGERWKAYAALVNQTLGMEISRTVQPEEGWEPLRREEVKYVLECQSCGAKILRSRMSKTIKYPWRYRCVCGGRLKRIQ